MDDHTETQVTEATEGLQAKVGLPEESGKTSTPQSFHCQCQVSKQQNGLCVYTKNSQCTNTATIERHCSLDLELLAVKCRPHYLPREISAVVVVAVYIPPDANASSALSCMLTAINKDQSSYPDGVFIVAGDFNHVNLKTVLPRSEQHVKCTTRGEKTLDCVYTNKAYRAFPLLHLGWSDHLSLFLTPAYHPIIKRHQPTIKAIKIW